MFLSEEAKSEEELELSSDALDDAGVEPESGVLLSSADLRLFFFFCSRFLRRSPAVLCFLSSRCFAWEMGLSRGAGDAWLLLESLWREDRRWELDSSWRWWCDRWGL